jgi:protein-S-isoprenylcysteine O-methyltransferase Ste14
MTVRLLGTFFALSAHMLLGVTVWFLVPFLMGSPDAPPQPPRGWWWWDALLVVQFGLPHSALLHPAVRRRLDRFLPRELFGCLFTLVTALSLLLLMGAWRPATAVVWRADGWGRPAVHAAYALSWVGLLYSLNLTGFGYQTGWTTFRSWVRGVPVSRRRFEARGAYRLLRHPAYLCFLGQLWLTPDMTLDRFLLAGLLTGYIALGSYLKDRRMVAYLGDAYREYRARVPGYPLAWGPLGRVPFPAPIPAGIRAVTAPVPAPVR